MIKILILYDHNHSRHKQFNLLLASWKNFSPYHSFSSTCFQQLNYINCWKRRCLLNISWSTGKKIRILLCGSFYTLIMQRIMWKMRIMIRIWNYLLKHTAIVYRLFQMYICHQQKFPSKSQFNFYKGRVL